jgi:putative transposase
LSERRACQAGRLRRSVYRYKPKPRPDQEIVAALLSLAHRKPEPGFGKLFEMLRRQEHRWNHKRLHRIYCQLRLIQRRKGKRRLPTRNPIPLTVSQDDE